MNQSQLDTRAIEISRVALEKIERHEAVCEVKEDARQKTMAEIKKIVESFGERFDHRMDRLMLYIIAGLGGAALAVFVAVLPWRVL